MHILARHVLQKDPTDKMRAPMVVTKKRYAISGGKIVRVGPNLYQIGRKNEFVCPTPPKIWPNMNSYVTIRMLCFSKILNLYLLNVYFFGKSPNVHLKFACAKTRQVNQ